MSGHNTPDNNAIKANGTPAFFSFWLTNSSRQIRRYNADASSRKMNAIVKQQLNVH